MKIRIEIDEKELIELAMNQLHETPNKEEKEKLAQQVRSLMCKSKFAKEIKACLVEYYTEGMDSNDVIDLGYAMEEKIEERIDREEEYEAQLLEIKEKAKEKKRELSQVEHEKKLYRSLHKKYGKGGS